MRATGAAVPGKTNPAMSGKFTGFNLRSCRFNQPAEFLALLFGDGCLEILDFGVVLAHEHHQGNFGNPGDPGIANQLGIK